MTKTDLAIIEQQVRNLYSNVNTMEMVSQPFLENNDYKKLTIETKAHSKDVREIMSKLQDLLTYLDNDSVATD